MVIIKMNMAGDGEMMGAERDGMETGSKRGSGKRQQEGVARDSKREWQETARGSKTAQKETARGSSKRQ